MKTFKGKNNEVLGTFLENTDVVVNPTLVGDEPEMTGIQVGGQKYKAPQGGGGGETYTAGEGINISEDNVISAEKTIVLVNELPNEGEADKLYKLPNGDVYEWAEIETQTDITEISVGKRFILADTINKDDYGRMVVECFKITGQNSRFAQISEDLTIIVSGQYSYLVIRSNSSPNRYESYCGFYCHNYYSQNPYWTKREQNFKLHPFIEITQTLIDSISSFGGSIEYITPLFKKEVTYSYGWSKISNYKLSESLELVDGALSIKNGFVNEGNPVFINKNILGMNDLEKICYLGTDGTFLGFKNCLIHASTSRNNGFTEDFSGYLKPESISDDGLVARFCSGVNKSENGEFRAVVELHYSSGRGQQGGYTIAGVVKSIEYIMGILTLTQGDTITDQMFDSLVAKDTETGMNLCFKNCFLKLIIHDSLGGQIICYPSNILNSSVSYRSGVIGNSVKKYYYDVTIYNNQHLWGYQITFINEEKAIPSWCNGYILTSNYTQMKKARLNMENLKNTLFNSSDYLSEPISSFIGTGTSYITIAILNNESSGAQRNSMITFICDKLENPDHCRIEVLLERETLYSKEHTFDSENFTWLDVFEFLYSNETDILDFNLCNAYFNSGTMILETPDPDKGLVLYDSVRFGFSNEIIFGNNDDGSTLYGLVLIKDVKGFFDFVIVEGGSSSSSSN